MSASANRKGQRGLRWAIYIRQSKKRRNAQGRVTTTSVELQDAACREAIAALDPSPADIRVIRDHGRSGRRGVTRPGRDELIRLARGRQIDAVMAYKASRVGRDIGESEALWNTCAEGGAFIAAADCHDLSSPVIRGVYFGMAAQQSADLSDYSRASAERRRAKGLVGIKTGVAYGLQWTGETLEPDPKEWPVVEEIFRLFDQGQTIGEIARHLSATGAPRRGANHAQWESTAVSQKLRSPWYVGLVPDNGGYWDAGREFIDRGTWERAQARLRRHQASKTGSPQPLSGLLYCGICRGWSPMSLCYSKHKRKDGSTSIFHRYRCIHHVRDRSFCAGQSIAAAQVEEFLLNQIRSVIDADELTQARFLRRQRRQAERGSERIGELDCLIAETERAQDALFERRRSGEVVPARIYNREMKALETKRNKLRDERERAVGEEAMGREAAALLKAELFGAGPLELERWRELPATRRNEFLRLLFPRGVFVEPRKDGARYGDIPSRLRPRSSEDAAASEARRSGPNALTAPSLPA